MDAIILGVYGLASVIICFMLFYISHDYYNALGLSNLNVLALGTSAGALLALAGLYVAGFVLVRRLIARHAARK
ncbi:hypothetical protein [Roseospira navarrensis]|uniref:Uncharacterized protein n=1 Tax=Roseospira navarrensis TaxID=140058 RepID=A0A7X2D6B7_9PROT|nr:hypothetical protein [Roseospira navarrensis]MQX38572.1 hypothetical protein [Roseospira navarrensis]